MKEKIIERLKDFEEKKKVTILYACESGSRAWGFPSTDSDYDVRFIYVHSYDWYLSIDKNKDVIEDVGKVLDFNGWELRKSLRLFRSNNAGLYEKLQSPVVYMERSDFKRKMNAVMSEFYEPISGLYHYLSLVRNFHEHELSTETPKLKKYFYAVRSILAAKWIREMGTVPPMEFSKLRTLQTNSDWNELVDHWLELKTAGAEALTVNNSSLMDNFLVEELEIGTAYAKSLAAGKKADSDILNTYFRQWVKEVSASF